VLDIDGTPLGGVYATGWIKRGPVGLIGHTKSDAAQTVKMLVEDLPLLPSPEFGEPEAFDRHLDSRGVEYTTWEGWEKLDAHEETLGANDTHPRERKKVVPREDMVSIARG
jgi:ferredoxin--NADP+ reductase